MKIEIYGTPNFLVPLTRRLVDALVICSEVNCGPNCNTLLSEGPIRVAMDLMIDLPVESRHCQVTFEELARLVNLCEDFPDHLLSIPQRADISEFAACARAALKLSNEISPTWLGEVFRLGDKYTG
jgi:hypothetical protein